MPLEFICRRCNWCAISDNRVTLNTIITKHFVKSHRHKPKPSPIKMKDVTVANQIEASKDYSIHLLSEEEFKGLQEAMKTKIFWRVINSPHF